MHNLVALPNTKAWESISQTPGAKTQLWVTVGFKTVAKIRHFYQKKTQSPPYPPPILTYKTPHILPTKPN